MATTTSMTLDDEIRLLLTGDDGGDPAAELPPLELIEECGKASVVRGFLEPPDVEECRKEWLLFQVSSSRDAENHRVDVLVSIFTRPVAVFCSCDNLRETLKRAAIDGLRARKGGES